MRYLLTILFCSFCLVSTGQRFESYVCLGMAGSQVSGDELSGFNKGGLLFGAGVSRQLNNHTSLNFSILYVEKGSRKPQDVEAGDTEYYLLKLNYIEIPFLVSYRFNKHLTGKAGLAYARLVKSSEEDANGVIPYREPFAPYDFSACASLAYEMNKHFELEATYSQSLLPIREHNGGETWRLNKGQYNTVISLALLYHFRSNRVQNAN